MRLPDYLALAFVGLTTLALMVCSIVRVRDVATRVQVGKPPVRGQQASKLPPDAQQALDDLLMEPGTNWRENELYIRQRSEP